MKCHGLFCFPSPFVCAVQVHRFSLYRSSIIILRLIWNGKEAHQRQAIRILCAETLFSLLLSVRNNRRNRNNVGCLPPWHKANARIPSFGFLVTIRMAVLFGDHDRQTVAISSNGRVRARSFAQRLRDELSTVKRFSRKCGFRWWPHYLFPVGFFRMSVRAGYCQRPLTISNYYYRRKSDINVFLTSEDDAWSLSSATWCVWTVDCVWAFVRWRTVSME